MYPIRITGVCLLFLIIAAAIPMGGLASNGIAGPGLNSEYSKIPIKDSSAVSEVPSALVSPIPLQLYAASENNTTNTSANRTELSNITAASTPAIPVSNATEQSTPAPTESNVTSDPGQHYSGYDTYCQRNICKRDTPRKYHKQHGGQ